MKQGNLKLRLFSGDHKWAGAGVALVVGLVLAAGTAFSAIWWGTLHSPQDSVSTTIRNLSILIGGVIAIILTVWRSLVAERQAKTAEDQAELARQNVLLAQEESRRQAKTAADQAELARQNVLLAQEQSLVDRYQQGAEMLGNQVLTVRLAGIYALANLSSQYPEKYHVPVVKLLCSFVRYPIVMDPHLRSEDERSSISNQPVLRADVQAALRAIADRDITRVSLENAAGYVVDLDGAHLADLNLTRANLTRVTLDGANLARAAFRSVDLSYASLGKANMERIYLLDSKLIGAAMQAGDLSYATIQVTDLSGARMPMKMAGTEILRSNLSGATFGPDDLTTIDISETNLSGTEFGIGGRSTRHVSESGEEWHTRDQFFGQITQGQLDKAFADPDNPPIIPDEMRDAETGEPLVWRNTGTRPARATRQATSEE